MKKIGIVGTGFMGTTHAEAWLKTDAALYGCTSVDADQANLFSKKYGAKVFPDFESMLGEVDIVDICVPTFLHHQMVLKAAEAGKDIICEKPLSLTVEEGIEMVAACQAAGVQLFVGHVVRFFPEYAAARERVLAGDVGKIAVVRLARKAFQPFNELDNWYIETNKSGGMIQDLMIHDFDYARWITGDVVRVFAKSITFNSNFQAPVDHAMVILTHANGAVSHIEGSWALPKPIFRTSLEIAGSEGLITFNSDEGAPISFALHKNEEDDQSVGLPGMPMTESPYTTQIKEFYHAIVNHIPARVTAEDGLASVQIARAAIESAKTGLAIEIQPLREVSA